MDDVSCVLDAKEILLLLLYRDVRETSTKEDQMAPRKSTKIPATTTSEEKTAPLAALQVTGCQVYPLKDKLGKTRAIVRIVLSESMQMTGIRIVEGSQGLFVAYPNDPGYKGDDYRSLFYPLTRELRDHVESVVLKAYEDAIKDK